MKWNPVLNLVKEIKEEYLKRFEDISYEQSNGKTCVENWVIEINNKIYSDMFKPLQLSQWEDMVLFRYGNYANIYNGEDDNTPELFWDKYDGLYRECRSIVIDVKREKIILAPFKKFMNLNEGKENSLEIINEKIKNAKKIEFSNKLDGSMQSASFDINTNRIIMAGSKAINPKNSWRLREGYATLLSQENYKEMIKNHPRHTFVFEFIHQDDAHVVSYSKEDEGLYLIGIRNNESGYQHPYFEVLDIAKIYNILTTKTFDLDLDKALEECKNKKSNEFEGFVLNIDGYFVKIKADDYVHVHRILSKTSSPNLILQSVADNTFDDLISKVPNLYRNRVLNIFDEVSDYLNLINDLVSYYFDKAYKHSSERKEFMIYVNNNIPKLLIGYVINIYNRKENNYLKRGKLGYINYKQMWENKKCLEKINQNLI